MSRYCWWLQCMCVWHASRSSQALQHLGMYHAWLTGCSPACLIADALVGTTCAGRPLLPGSTNSSRTPEPGYVLLITCPTACCTTSRQPGGNTSGSSASSSSVQLYADFSGAMGPLCEALQAAVGPHWGFLPSIWAKAAAHTSTSGGGLSGAAGSATRPAGVPGARGPAVGIVRPRHAAGSDGIGGSAGGRRHAAGQGLLESLASGGSAGAAAGLASSGCMPAHGLQMASHTRSLAAVQVGVGVD